MNSIEYGVWKHKGFEIRMTDDGYFYFADCDNTLNRYTTLSKAISAIDKITEDYYKMSLAEFKKMLNKLTDKEKGIVTAMYNELAHHIGNAYCELGVSLDEYNIEGLTY